MFRTQSTRYRNNEQVKLKCNISNRVKKIRNKAELLEKAKGVRG